MSSIRVALDRRSRKNKIHVHPCLCVRMLLPGRFRNRVASFLKKDSQLCLSEVHPTSVQTWFEKACGGTQEGIQGGGW